VFRKEVRELSRGIRGVALVVVNPDDEVLILQEFESKPHLGKYPGMFSIPMETSRPGEADRSALVRLVAEEAPGLGDKLEIREERLGVYRIVPHVWVSLYGATAIDAALPDQQGGESEVGNHAWVSPTEAVALWLRQGAAEMLEDYIAGRTGVVRRWCRTAKPRTFVLSQPQPG
jgi:8-oxo-dGTP pyrophosphatase MutT (NUDIX family)